MAKVAYGFRQWTHGEFESNQRAWTAMEDGSLHLKFKGGVKGAEWAELLIDADDVEHLAEFLKNYCLPKKRGV